MGLEDQLKLVKPVIMPEQKASELISFNEAIIQQKDAYSYIEEGVPKDRN